MKFLPEASQFVIFSTKRTTWKNKIMFVDDSLVYGDLNDEFARGPENNDSRPTKVEMLALSPHVNLLNSEGVRFEDISTETILRFLGMSRLFIGLAELELPPRVSGMSFTNYITNLSRLQRGNHHQRSSSETLTASRVGSTMVATLQEATSRTPFNPVTSVNRGLVTFSDAREGFISESPTFKKRREGKEPIVEPSNLVAPDALVSGISKTVNTTADQGMLNTPELRAAFLEKLALKTHLDAWLLDVSLNMSGSSELSDRVASLSLEQLCTTLMTRMEMDSLCRKADQAAEQYAECKKDLISRYAELARLHQIAHQAGRISMLEARNAELLSQLEDFKKNATESTALLEAQLAAAHENLTWISEHGLFMVNEKFKRTTRPTEVFVESMYRSVEIANKYPDETDPRLVKDLNDLYNEYCDSVITSPL